MLSYSLSVRRSEMDINIYHGGESIVHLGPRDNVGGYLDGEMIAIET